MLTEQQFKIGGWFHCVYNGKRRAFCEVIEVYAGHDSILVRTRDGYRRFQLDKIEDFKMLK